MWQIFRRYAPHASLLSLMIASFIAIDSFKGAQAAEPIVRRITPVGLTAGTRKTLSVLGERLEDVTGIQFYGPGLKATHFEVVAPNQIKFQVETDATLPNHLYAFRLVTKTGLSMVRYLGVNRNPAIDESEPSNNDFANPQVVGLRTTVDGTVQNEDVDYFAIDLSEGQILSVELEGLRHAYDRNFFDPSVTIYDSERFELASSDDSPLLRQDCLCSIQAPKAGRYIVEVRESAFGGNDDCLYRLHISDKTRPVAVIPSGGKPGEMLHATLVDDLGNTWQESFQLPSSPVDSFPIWSQRDGYQAPSPNFVCVSGIEQYVEVEPNGDATTLAAVQNLPGAFHGILQEANDEDFFVFHAKKDQQLEIRSVARSLLRSPADTVLNIFKVGGGQIVGNDDSNGPDAFIDFKVPEDGDYAMRVRDHLGRGGSNFVYRIEINSKQPAVFPTIVEQERLVSQTLIIPRGSRTAVEVTVNRRNLGGDAEIKVDGLPEGVTYETIPCVADRNSVPLILYASESASMTSTLVNLTTSIKQNESFISGQLVQRSQLIRAQNDRDVWGHDANKAALAVTDAAPFDIEVTQPNVPLVRDGSMDINVKLTRKKGFTDPVRLRFLYNAPGMSANGGIKFEKDQSEVNIPITANGNARIGVWTFTVLGRCRINGGDITVSSKPFTIEIADRLFDFAFNKTMTEPSKSADVLIGAILKRPVEGKIELEMVGLPPGTSSDAPKLPFDPASNQIVFKLNVAPDAKTGSFKTIVCRATVTSDKGVITQVNGNGEVQIDAPLQNTTAPTPAPEVSQAEQTAAPKVLTRIEQLRAMREQK